MNTKGLIKTIVAAAAIATATTLSAADGKAIYTKECARCHGADGKGQTKMGKKMGARDYTTASVQDEVTDERFHKSIKDGFKDKAGKVLMQPSEDLSDADIKAVIAYMRAFRK